MKTIIALAILSIFSFSDITAQWEIINEGFQGTINTIDFVNDNVGWIAGNNGTLFKTTDGGENWNTITTDENWDIQQIDFINNSVGWAIRNNVIMKSTNGGISWVTQKQNNTDLRSIYIIDENNAYVGDGEGKLLKTTNGGGEWSILQLNSKYEFSTIWAINPEVVVLVGTFNGDPNQGIILRTKDGGNSWQEIIIPEFHMITNLQFLNDSTCYFLAEGEEHSFFCKSVDTCHSWTVVSEDIISYCFINDTIVYSTNGESIMKSTDGGINWQDIYSSNLLTYYKLYINPLGVVFITCNIGRFSLLRPCPSLCKSTDGGYSWIIEKYNYPFYDVCFVNDDEGIIVGGFIGSVGGAHGHWEDGHIFETFDGGRSLDDKFSTGEIELSCLLVDEHIGYTIDNGGIYKTTDIGSTWNQVFGDNSNEIGYNYSFMGIDIYFIDQNNGWAVGNYWMPDTNGAGILGTKDGGGSWELFWKYPNSENISNNLNSITYSGTSCWSVGEGGMIVQYTPKTGRVRQTTVTDLPLNKVFFSDRNNGWIAGGYQNKHGFQTILLKTTNSGANWNIVTNVPYLFRDIWFIDNNHGWAIGYDINRRGGILKTTDGGDNWFVDTSNLPAQLNSLFIKDNYGWAVGYNGLILRNTDAGTVWVKDENNIYPTEFRLEQNYPNPFNPSTKIRYSIPQSSKVVIKLFDILGNEIETLINEEKPAGTYAVEFDAITLPSGVYFYQLRAGNFVETKKMLLLK